MPLTWRAMVIALDAVTALCATLNLAYFLERLLSGREDTPRRRVAALVLALVSLAALLEAVFLLSAAASVGSPDFASPQWTVARATGCAASVCLSALVLRRLLAGEPL